MISLCFYKIEQTSFINKALYKSRDIDAGRKPPQYIRVSMDLADVNQENVTHAGIPLRRHKQLRHGYSKKIKKYFYT